MKKLDASASLVEELLSQYPRYIEPLVEKGMLLETQAGADQGDWTTPLAHWQGLAQKHQGLMVAALGAEMVSRNRTPSDWDLSADSSLPVTDPHVPGNGHGHAHDHDHVHEVSKENLYS